eukprot:TRINITY_DN167_c0_g2_i6.p1 TRINITY_DN167_c0_g2~~TRINITY_DN167_c0_g2_i6.p1  ORF type:complete len:161 (+),score=25.61 TRINITY_DN167_c0_g2_i6:379-861(+)
MFVVKSETYSAPATGGIGWIVGRMNGGHIRSTRVSGGSLGDVTLQGPGRHGGFVGLQQGGTIDDCAVFFFFHDNRGGTGSNGIIRGFVGYQLETITHSVVDGVSVKESVYALGGFAGVSGWYILSCKVVDTTNSGAIIQSSALETGGFVGGRPAHNSQCR